ncbi:hypothetical protein FDK21_01275 [Cohaesibacter sp. CAU 1516]|uniref:hypothetical protein n=1 Tax=Cohaesibacter sp. CAU 1516 TaxID=2576038 RepID=UPI0010FD00C3|nr:hypothetical protein [Cohaesibacter sp. CAU 1516]TLP48325.1 hypothetical protein FDK21_01275 [Cohaesibacter sp. CAU 1516]
MQQNQDVRQTLFDQFSRSVLADGWRSVSCAEIATAAGVDLHIAFVEFRNRYAYVTELIRRTDAAMLDAYDREMVDEPARERLLDVMMARFEAMQGNRALIVALSKAARRDPMLSLHLVALSRLTADWFLDIAQISPAGISGIIRSKGALATYARVFRVWLEDDSDDLTKTMSALDKYLKQGESALRRAERIACLLPKAGRRCRKSARRTGRDEAASTDGLTPSEGNVTDMSAVDEPPAQPMPS